MLLIQCALHAEARPFIEHFRLKRRHDMHSYACYSSDDVTLIESGTGKLNAAAATAWLGATITSEYPVCMNIGIAGHATRELGTMISCQRIEDSASGKRWYPPRLIRNLPQGENLLTLDKPGNTYPQDNAIDMEASGFLTAATRFTPLELIQSLKIISDNQDNPPGRFNTKQVVEMITPHITKCVDAANELLALRQILTGESSKANMEPFMQQWQFSQYQQKQLSRVLQRHIVIFGNEPDWDNDLKKIKSSKGVISELKRRINKQHP
ncbi:MAG: hypothetical protein EP297_08605 [Gammaproteobacteria bacterium]|nr:MAG: hypothetical protein EP297_08605 [Gammaproteobacteria bacterium]